MTDEQAPLDLTSELDGSGFDTTIRMLVGLWGASQAISAGPVELLRQRSMMDSTPTLLSEAAIGEALRRGIVSDQQFSDVLTHAGYSPNAIRVMRETLPQLLPAGELVELLRRGSISRGEYDSRMSALGFDDETSGRLAELVRVLVPIQDVLRFMVREVYTPEVRARFGQDEGFPDAVLELTKRLGLDDQDVRDYWAAHWQLPSPEQGFQMLQRAVETGATEADLDTLLRALDIMPFWREKLKKIAYNPITRVDIRRMHKMGLLDHAGLVDRYQRIGYNAEDAEALAVFTERLNGTEDRDALEPFLAPLRSRARSLYMNNVITDDEVQRALTDLGHTPEQIAAFMQEAELARVADEREEITRAIKSLYTQGHISAGDTVDRLRAAGYDEETAERVIAPWHFLAEQRQLRADEKEGRDLTRADILGAYKDGLLSSGEATRELGDLGFDPSEVAVLVGRVDKAIAREAQQDAERIAHSLYLARRLSRAAAQSQLVAAKVPPERVVLLLGQWDAELDARAPELSTAQIQAALRRGLMSETRALERLKEEGYSEEDRTILVELAKAGDGIAPRP